MKKNNFTKSSILIFSLLAMFVLNACSPLITGDNTDSTVNSDRKIKVSLELSGLNTTANNDDSRTIIPVAENGSTIEKYELIGYRTKDSMGNSLAVEYQILGTWTSTSALNSAVVEMEPGTWIFNLMAYKSEEGTLKQFYSSTITDQILTFTPSGVAATVLTFDMKHLEMGGSCLQKGSMNVIVQVPHAMLNHANVELYYYDSTPAKHNIPLSVSRYTAGTDPDPLYDRFVISQSGIPNGFYFLQMNMCTDSSDTPTAVMVEGVKISGGLTSSKTLTYNNLNNAYQVKYHPQLAGTETYVMPSDFNYNDSMTVTLPDNLSGSVSATHYEFTGWYTSSDYSGSPVTGWAAGAKNGNVDLYAKWTPKEYNLVIGDWRGGQASAKAYTGDNDGTWYTTVSGVKKIKYGQAVPSPDCSLTLTDGNQAYFQGWYKDAACTTTNKIGNSLTVSSSVLTDEDSDGVEDTVNLYAKWNYKYVYVSPDKTLASYGDDSNSGCIPTKSFLTIEEAKKYMEGNAYGEIIYAVSTVRVISDAYSVANPGNESYAKNNPSDLTTAAYNNAYLKRYTTLTADSLVNVMGGDVTIKNVTLDGGAVWDSDGAFGVNSGIKVSTGASSGAIIHVGTKCTLLTLTGKVTVCNNEVDTVSAGGGISSQGGLLIDSKDVVIKDNKAGYGGGIYYDTLNGNTTLRCEILKGVLENNYGERQGGAIQFQYYRSGLYEVKIGSETNNQNGTDLIIRNNKAQSGGALFINFGTNVKINKALFTGNKVVYGAYEPTTSEKSGYGGAIYSLKRSAGSYTDPIVEIKDCKFNSNSAELYGGAIYTNELGTKSYLSNCTFTGNSSSTADGYDIAVEKDSILAINSCTLGSDVSATKNNVYVVGKISVSGQTNLGTVHLVKPATGEGIIYPRNFLQLPDGTQNASALAYQSGKSTIGVISVSADLPDEVYDTSDSTTYVEALGEETVGDMTGLNTKFAVSSTSNHTPNASYVINDLGRIYCNNFPVAGGAIVNPFGQTVTFEITPDSFSAGTAQTITISAKIDGTTVPAENFSTTFTSFAYEVTSYGSLLDSGTTRSFTVPSTYGAGTYTVNITGTYKGAGFSASCDFVIE